MAKRGLERKSRVEAEGHLVAAYIAETYPQDQVMLRVRLGIIESELTGTSLTEAELNMVGIFRRWADAIVIRSNELILIEGAIRPSLGDPSIVEGYAELIPSTPELAQYRNLPLRLELVGAIWDPVVGTLAERRGIKYVVWTDQETLNYLGSIMPRHARSPRSGGFPLPE